MSPKCWHRSVKLGKHWWHHKHAKATLTHLWYKAPSQAYLKLIAKTTTDPDWHSLHILVGCRIIHNATCGTKAIPASRSHVSQVGQDLGDSRLVVALPTSNASFFWLVVCMSIQLCAAAFFLYPLKWNAYTKALDQFSSLDRESLWLCRTETITFAK